MAEYTEYTTTTQLQPKVISQASTIATQYAPPTIQNGSPYAQNVVYAQPNQQLQPQVAYMPTQPYIKNGNGLIEQVAMQKINGDVAEIKRLTQQLEVMKNGQNNQEKSHLAAFENIRNEMDSKNNQDLMDLYNDKKESYRKQKEELEQLRKYKEEQEKKEGEQRQKEELEKRFEDERGKLEEQRGEIDNTREALESVDTSAFSDPNALRNYLNDIDNISDIKKFRSLIEEEYGNLKKENEKNKEKNGSYLKTLEDQLSKNQQEITSKQTELNRHQSSKSFIKKIIEWISGSKDKKGQELKERLAELRKEVEGNMTDIKKQREVLKEILLDGAQIMQKETEEMKKIDSENMKRLFNRREQFKKIEESKEIKQDYQTSLINTIRGNTSNIRDLTAIRDRIFNERNSKWSKIYPEKDVNNNNSKIMNLNSINGAKGKDNGRW